MFDEHLLKVTYFGRTNHRNSNQLFGIRNRDRLSHVYVCGKTGVGKSHLLRTMFVQDLQSERGCAFLDPHGDVAESVLQGCDAPAQRRMVYLKPHDERSAWRYNPLRLASPGDRARVAAGLIETFKKLWPDDWGPRLEHLLRHVLLTLLEQNSATFADVPLLLTDRPYRQDVVRRLSDPVVQQFWTNEFDRYSMGFKSVVVAPLQNKVGALLADPTTRRFLTEEGDQIDLAEIMNSGRVLIVNLDKGSLGEGPSALIGSLLLSGVSHAALQRSGLPEHSRRPFYVFADEFQTWTTLSVATMLAELRKYRVGLTLANQHLTQLDPAIRDAVFGNVGTTIAFRVSAQDASYLVREMVPTLEAQDLTNLERFHFVTRLLIDGVQSRVFSAISLSEV